VHFEIRQAVSRHGERPRNTLYPTLLAQHIAFNRAVFNPTESKNVVGITNYVDLGGWERGGLGVDIVGGRGGRWMEELKDGAMQRARSVSGTQTLKRRQTLKHLRAFLSQHLPLRPHAPTGMQVAIPTSRASGPDELQSSPSNARLSSLDTVGAPTPVAGGSQGEGVTLAASWQVRSAAAVTWSARRYEDTRILCTHIHTGLMISLTPIHNVYLVNFFTCDGD